MKALRTILIVIAVAVFPYISHAQIDERFNPTPQILKIMEEDHVPGVAVALVARDSIIWINALGLAEVENATQVTKNTLFTIGSLSKTFVAAAALVAQEKGFLDINAPIKELVPALKFSNRWSSSEHVRLIHLLEHTSGFDEAHFRLEATATSSTAFSDIMQMSRNSLNTRWRPGNYFEYNNFGYIVAAHIVEECVGMPFETFVKENILSPLGMYRATYHPPPATPGFSKGYSGADFNEVPFPDVAQWPAGSLTATIEDMSNFVIMLLNNGEFRDGQILSPVSVESMETPETSLRARAGIRYGYGKGLYGKFENGYLFYEHRGNFGGFLAEFGYSRQLDIGFVILINNVDGNRGIKAIKRELLASIAPSKGVKNPPDTRTSPGQPDALTGCYQPITTPFLGEITQFAMRLIDLQFMIGDAGQIYQKSVVGGRQSLIHVNDLLFRRSGEPIATSAFVEAPDGTWQWLDETAYRQIPVWWGYMQFYTAVICILVIILSFLILLFWLPARMLRKEKYLLLQLFPFMAICSFVGMVTSFLTLYDTARLYSPGAILFYVLGWSFLSFSFLGLTYAGVIIYKRTRVKAGIKYHSILVSLACCVTASYLFYWDIIGLALWNY